MADHNEFGKLAEKLAKVELEEKGYEIIFTNYRFQKAEIDIIAKFEGKIIIVEVKARANNYFLEPHEAVNKRKIKLIVTAADEFLKEQNRMEEVRFDIISVLQQENGKFEITHIENAFEAFDAN